MSRGVEGRVVIGHRVEDLGGMGVGCTPVDCWVVGMVGNRVVGVVDGRGMGVSSRVGGLLNG